ARALLLRPLPLARIALRGGVHAHGADPSPRRSSRMDHSGRLGVVCDSRHTRLHVVEPCAVCHARCVGERGDGSDVDRRRHGVQCLEVGRAARHLADDRRRDSRSAVDEAKLVVGSGRSFRGELPTLARVQTESTKDVSAVADPGARAGAAAGKGQRPSRRVKGDGLSFGTVLFLAAVFTFTRAVVHLSGSPYFDPDTYKYLAGADSLLAGKGLPHLFTD